MNSVTEGRKKRGLTWLIPITMSFSVCCFAPAVQAEETSNASSTSHPPFAIGPELGVYIPTSGKAANRFGSQWWSVGLGLGKISSGSTKGTFSPDISLIARYSSTNHVYMVPAGIQYKVCLDSASQFQPYVGVSGDFLFTDVMSPVDNIHSGVKVRGDGSIFIGAKVSSNGYIEARYIAASQVDGMNLSGVRLSAGIRF